MLGFIIGTACLIGLIKTLRHGSCGYGYRGFGPWGGGHRFGCGPHGYGGYGGHGGWEEHGDFGGHGPWGYRGGPRGWGRGRRGGFGPRFFLNALFERIDATPAQEKVIVAAMEELREAAQSHREELRKSRADIAKAMRSQGFDEVLLGELFARHDAAIEAMRKAFVGAMAKVHEALDERQRARVADLIESGPWAFRGPFAV